MKFEAISEAVKGVPYIGIQNARYLYDLIIRERITRILELGIAHGTATCYMAAALEEVGEGRITSVDLVEARAKFSPSSEEQLAKVNLQRFVNITRMETGYTWFLHDEIKRLTKNDICAQEYDLCIIDGPKNWTIDGCAFFLADKVLKENGWIIFDDYNWTYENADQNHETTDGITHRLLSEAERKTPQVKEVFEFLVKQHPSYSQFVRTADTDWAIARKVLSTRKEYTVLYKESFGTILLGALTGAKRQVKTLLRR